MKLSYLFIRTLKEAPADAKSTSNKLLLRGSYIRKVAGGIYSYLPLCSIVLKKIKKIIREELETIWAQEIIIPLLNPQDLYPPVSIKKKEGSFYFKDRSGRTMSIGTSSEEIITDLISKEVRSYREMPLFLYQIIRVLRDDNKAKGGLLRPKEFFLNEIYSFHTSIEDLEKGYKKICEVYLKIFKICGIDMTVLPSYSEDGYEGSKFLIFNELGDELIYVCPECGYMATSEKTDFFISEETFIKEESSPVESVFTPGKKTIEEVTAFMGEEPTSFAKTLLFKTDGKPVAALVRGDRELNPHKIKKLLNVKKLEMADDKLVEKVTGAPVGFAGPVGLGKIPVLADLEVKNMQSLIVGANKGDYHIKNVMPGRDFNISHYGDLRMAATGDLCKNCKKLLEVKSAFKLAEGFKIEDKYTEPMKATFFDEQSKEHKIIMGSYSLNISQTMAAIVETHHDENGIIWPSSVSPFDVIVLLLEPSDEKQKEIALNIYNFLKKEGVDVLLDDRDSRAGFKFKDADLLGIPLRITVGYKAVKEGLVELKIRRKNKNIVFPVQEVISEVKNLFKM